jgi:hypothetical protein
MRSSQGFHEGGEVLVEDTRVVADERDLLSTLKPSLALDKESRSATGRLSLGDGVVKLRHFGEKDNARLAAMLETYAIGIYMGQASSTPHQPDEEGCQEDEEPPGSPENRPHVIIGMGSHHVAGEKCGAESHDERWGAREEDQRKLGQESLPISVEEGANRVCGHGFRTHGKCIENSMRMWSLDLKDSVGSTFRLNPLSARHRSPFP